MVRHCCIKDCNSEWSPGTDLSFHSFPRKEEAKQKWLEAIPPGKLRSNKLNYACLCSKHFTEDCFSDSFMCTSLKNLLKKDSIPTLFDGATEPEYIDLEMLSEPSDNEDLDEGNTVVLMRDAGVQTTYSKRDFDNLVDIRRREENIRQRLKRSQLKVTELTRMLEVQMKRPKMEIIAEAIQKYIPEDRREIFLNEFSHHVPQPFKKDYEFDIKHFAKAMYRCSREAYDILRKKMTLPEPATVQKWLHTHNDPHWNNYGAL